MAQGLLGRLRLIRLLDMYGRVLTAHQQRLLHFYLLDDLSLGEIGDRLSGNSNGSRRRWDWRRSASAATGVSARSTHGLILWSTPSEGCRDGSPPAS